MDNNKIRKYIKQGREDKFYKSYSWQKKRMQILERDNHECQRCKELGVFGKGEAVHHIKHLKEFPELGMSDDNLITLCFNCHNVVHPEKGFVDGIKKEIHGEKWE